MQSHLPIPVTATPELARDVSNEIALTSKQVVEVTQVVYLGDESGISVFSTCRIAVSTIWRP
jgi:hypothetical protein